jgi:glycosyltransferase involved in cell wall biosynthesis
MIKNPIVSVLIATYNRGHLVTRAINSVLNQTLENLEVVVVDDASEDDTSEVIGTYDDKRVRYLRNNKNRGFGSSINRAFEISRGRFIANLGDDDEWIDPEKLERQLSYFDENHDRLGAICTGFEIVSEQTGRVSRRVKPKKPDNLERHILKYNRIMNSGTALIPRPVWEEVGGCDERIPRGVDSDLFRTIILDGYTVDFIPEVMLRLYVDRPGRMTNKRTQEQIQSHIESEEWKLRKFSDSYDRYPKARSKVYERIGTHYINLWKLTEDDEDIREARRWLADGLRADRGNALGVFKFGWSYAVEGLATVGLPVTYIDRDCF